MPLYRPSELLQFLSDIGRKATRTLSQNFLIDGNIVAKIVDAVHIPEDGTVIEIGPGPGVLTEALLAKGYALLAFEKDTDFAYHLQRLSKTSLRAFEADILEVDLSRYNLEPSKTAVVSNVPYHITTPILRWLCLQRRFFCQAVVMMQKEVADKLLAKKPSLLEHELSLFFDIKEVCAVSKSSFMPSPKVDSKVVSFQVKKKPLLPEESFEGLMKLLDICFSHRRKMIVPTLAKLYGRECILNIMRKMQISEQSRPEELSLENWIALYDWLSNCSRTSSVS
jgi:16S rRNA (adenine1518-N6/adenine1519-N6)-dimethyltransferase